MASDEEEEEEEEQEEDEEEGDGLEDEDDDEEEVQEEEEEEDIDEEEEEEELEEEDEEEEEEEEENNQDNDDNEEAQEFGLLGRATGLVGQTNGGVAGGQQKEENPIERLATLVSHNPAHQQVQQNQSSASNLGRSARSKQRTGCNETNSATHRQQERAEVTTTKPACANSASQSKQSTQPEQAKAAATRTATHVQMQSGFANPNERTTVPS